MACPIAFMLAVTTALSSAPPAMTTVAQPIVIGETALSKLMIMNAARRPVSVTSHATRSEMPIKTGTVTANVGIQKRPVLSAMIPERRADAMLIAVATVGNVLMRTTEYRSLLALRYSEKGCE